MLTDLPRNHAPPHFIFNVSSTPQVESTAPDGKNGKEPSKLAKTSGLTSSASATVAVAGRPRTVVGKTNSASAIQEPSRQPLSRPAAAAVAKPIITIESELLEEVDEDGESTPPRSAMQIDIDNDHAAFSTVMMDRHRDEMSETDEEEEDIDDPEDWTRLEAEELEDAQAMLHDIRQGFDDDLDLYDTTMVAEYAEDIFAYMEELEVRPG